MPKLQLNQPLPKKLGMTTTQHQEQAIWQGHQPFFWALHPSSEEN